jgi:TRAP-type C4-dicarboxylate transport system substrate-binding protein
VCNRAKLSRTAATIVALFPMATASAVARQFRATDIQGEDCPTVQALRGMGRMIAERSGGRHEFHIFRSRRLGEEKETVEQPRVRAIDLNRTDDAQPGTFMPTMNMPATPFLFRSIEHPQNTLDGPIGNQILDSIKPYGYVGLRDPAAAQPIERIRKVE